MQLHKKPSINYQSVISISQVHSSIFQDEETQQDSSYSKQQFIKLTKDIASQNPLCSYPQQDLSDIYDKILQAKGHVSAQEFNCFIDAVKQKNKQSFQNQLEAYQKLIKANKSKGKTVLEGQDFKQWIQEKQMQGYVTDVLYKIVGKYKYISLQKLQQFLDKIKKKFRNQSQIFIPNRISIQQSSIDEEELDFDIEDSQISLNKIQYLKSLVNKFITDPMAQQKIIKELTTLSLLIIQFQQNKLPTLKDQIQNLKELNKQLQNAVIQTEQQIQIKSEENIKYQNQLIELTQEVRDIKKDLFKTQLKLSQKQVQNQQLRIVTIQYETDLLAKTEESRQYATEFIKLKNQYQQTLIKQQENMKKQKQDQSKNLFPTRSLKQQLQDANIKLKKLKEQKNKLIVDLQSNEQNYQMKIEDLQKQLQDLRLEKIRATQLRVNGISQLSNIYVNSRRSRGSLYSSVTSVVTIDRKNNEQGKKQMQSILQQKDNQNKQKITNSKFAKKQKIQVLQAQLFQTFDNVTQEQEDGKRQDKYNFVNVDFNKLKNMLKLDGILSVVQEDAQNQDKNSYLQKQKQQPQNKNQNQNISIPKATSQIKIFLAKAHIISKSGDKFQKYLLVTPKSIYYLDSKMRTQKQILFQRINKITFCYNNLDVLLFSFKRTDSPLKKKSIAPQKDIIFSIKERKQLIQFLHQKTFAKIIQQNQIKVVFAKEEDIWVKETDDSTNVLSMYKNMYNPFRLIVSWKQSQNNAFKLQLCKQAFLSKTYYCLALLQTSGLYCFELQYDLLQKVRPFIYLLPFVKRVNITRSDKRTLRFQYLDWSDSKTFFLKLKSQKQCTKFLIQCKKQIQTNDNMLIGRQKVGKSLFDIKQ